MADNGFQNADQLRKILDTSMPAAKHAKLGQVLVDLINAVNAGGGTDVVSIRTQLTALIVDVAAIRAKFIAALSKLDLDAGVTDTNYTSLESPAAMTAVAPSAATAATVGALGTR